MATTEAGAARVFEREREEWERRTPRSRVRYERAKKVLPGADTRAITFYRPYPAVIESMSGIDLVDVDGNRYRDSLLNYTSMIAGHAHPQVLEAAADAMQHGTAVAAPVHGQVELAEELVRRVPSVELVRFTNSGTEATMTAVRVARTYTGRPFVLKASGGYHGSYPDLDVAMRPGTFPPGIPESTATLLVPYNDLPALERMLAERGSEIAAVILEPVLGSAGVIAGSGEYLQGAQRAARAAGALFILDEVITFRLSPGGAQLPLGLDPDLTTFGKFVGGGFPVGALGGKAEVMEVMAPGASPGFLHSGTFNGNPVTMAAGLATLALLTGDVYERLDRLGSLLGKRLREAINETGAKAQVTQVGSMANVHFTEELIVEADAAQRVDPTSVAAFHLGLLNRGVFIAPRGMLALSIHHDETHVEEIAGAATEVLAAMNG